MFKIRSKLLKESLLLRNEIETAQASSKLLKESSPFKNDPETTRAKILFKICSKLRKGSILFKIFIVPETTHEKIAFKISSKLWKESLWFKISSIAKWVGSPKWSPNHRPLRFLRSIPKPKSGKKWKNGTHTKFSTSPSVPPWHACLNVTAGRPAGRAAGALDSVDLRAQNDNPH